MTSQGRHTDASNAPVLDEQHRNQGQRRSQGSPGQNLGARPGLWDGATGGELRRAALTAGLQRPATAAPPNAPAVLRVERQGDGLNLSRTSPATLLSGTLTSSNTPALTTLTEEDSGATY
jgi:hypothetical protein